ncbi:monovalent cation/H+ antiporter complex subunit F [Spirochaeta dissipatitropha]
MIMWLIVLFISLSLVCLIRVLRGPSLLDRIAAADAIGLLLTLVLVLLGLYYERSIFIDIAIVYSLLMFADLLVITRYLEQGRH